MRLAYLNSRYPRASQVFVRREVEGLRARGVDLVTMSVRRSEDLLSDADRHEASVSEWLSPARPGRYLRAHLSALRHPAAWLSTLLGALRDAPPGHRRAQLGYWGGAIVVWDLLRRRGVEHIHVHFSTNAADIALLGARMGRASGAGPSSFSMHLHGPTDFYNVELNRLALKGREAAGIVCTSDHARGQTLTWVPPEAASRTVVVRYAIPVPAQAKASYVTDGPLRVLNIGRLAPVKAHGVLLDAVADLRTRGVDIELDVVGDGPLRESLAARTAELGLTAHVRWHGALGSDRVAELLAQADAFCLPSFSEGLAVSLLEAMATGLPVVATAITGIPEAVTSEKNGLLVRPARADLLAAALERVVGDAALRERLGRAARETIVARFELDKSNDALLAALEAIAP